MQITHFKTRLFCCLCWIVSGLILIPTGQAQSPPLWEVGIGVTALRLPDYRGSEQSHNYLFPVPWFVYRGEVFKADREGIRARLFDSDRVELDVSVNGSVPVRSDRNRARNGMPDLNPSLEIGPVLNITVWRSEKLPGHAQPKAKLDVRLPVRSALTYQNGQPRDIGWITTPHINLDLKLPTGTGKEPWNLGMLLGVLASTQRHHAYFYDVAPEYATPARNAYRTPGGYGGWQAIVAISRRSGQWWLGGFAKYDDVSDARFVHSPLITAHQHWSMGIALSYIFAQSRRPAPDQ